MNVNIIKEVIELSLAGKISFGQVVMKLMAEGFESYHVDYVRLENRYYMPDGESHVETISHEMPKAALEFDGELVKRTIKRIQAGEINYIQFSEDVLKAGCVYYIVYLTGKRVIYFGRNGDFHTEYFTQ